MHQIEPLTEPRVPGPAVSHGRATPGAALVLVACIAVLAGCASGPQRPTEVPSAGTVIAGPTTPMPPDIARIPDAEPKVETIRPGGANRPYEVRGQSYVPITQDQPFTERGVASWYGPGFHGRRTASGEVYNMHAMTAAHPTLPIPSYVRVRNPANNREVVLRINDRGPFHGGRIIDLSYTAAVKLDLHRGVGKVEIARITFDDIRTGAWRQTAPAETVLAAVRAEPADVRDAPPALSSPSPSAPPTEAPPPAPPAPAVTPTVAAVADGPPARAYTQPARGFWVQLGAFRDRNGAQNFHTRVVNEADWLSPLLAVFDDAALFRLQAGPYPSRLEARGAAERVREVLKLVPMIVERK